MYLPKIFTNDDDDNDDNDDNDINVNVFLLPVSKGSIHKKSYF